MYNKSYEGERITTNDIYFREKVHNILIVDDDKNILDALALTLKRAKEFKSNISIAENAKNALKELNHKSYDVVLSDFRMPKMDGIEFLKIVNKKYPWITRILITAYADIKLAEIAIKKADIDHFIEKPWHEDELRFLIHKSLKKDRKR